MLQPLKITLVICYTVLALSVAGVLLSGILGRLDVLVNPDSPNADRGLINESLSTEVDRALETLTERERDIIKYFFGIGCSEMTLEEIGEKFDLTRERVRQIKEKAIRRLRHSSRSKLLKSYLG